MRTRFGQSNIFGGTLVILIILSAYGLYLTYNEAQSDYMEAQANIRKKTLEMQQESLTFHYRHKWENGYYNRSEQYLFLENSGSFTSHIIYIIDLGSKVYNYSTDLYLYSGSSIVLLDEMDALNITFLGEKIQFITELGNVFQSNYLPKRDTPVEDYEVHTVYGGLQQVIGDFIFDYDTFYWTNFTEVEINGTDYYTPVKWVNSWKIPVGQDVIFRISLKHLGEYNKTLSKFTVVHFIDEGQKYNPFFIIYDKNQDYNHELFTDYAVGSIKVQPDQDITLYFGSENAGTIDVTNYFNKLKVGLYNGIITIYDTDEDYSQAFPFVGITIVP